MGDNVYIRKLERLGRRTRRVADLNQDVVEALAKVRTTATEGQYASSLRAYVTFCSEFNCTGSEVADEHWARYAGWRYRLQVRAESIVKDFSKLRTKLGEIGVQVPLLRNMPLTMGYLRAQMKRDNILRPKRKRKPITTVHLRDLVAEMQRDPAITNEEKVLYRAMYTGAMFGFLRVSEFIRGGAGGCENPPLQVKHVQFLVHKETGKRMCVLTLPPTKTDQSGNEENFRLALGELGEEDAEICPYRAMWALIQLKGRHANGDEDLFTVPHCALFPKYHTFVKRMRAWLGRAGYSEAEYFSHSFRIGGCTTAGMLKMDKEHIKILGRWKSAAWETYLHFDLGLQGLLTVSLEKLTARICE